MKAGEYIRALAEFVSGEIELSKFAEIVDARLFELLQKPEMTDEKRILSTIELYLHEAEESLRDEAEVYTIVQFILDDILLTKLPSDGVAYFSAVTPKLPYVKATTFDLEAPDKKQTNTQVLSVPLNK